jgi:hypothetical protein
MAMPLGSYRMVVPLGRRCMVVPGAREADEQPANEGHQ